MAESREQANAASIHMHYMSNNKQRACTWSKGWQERQPRQQLQLQWLPRMEWQPSRTRLRQWQQLPLLRVERLENESKSSTAAHAQVPAKLVEFFGEAAALTCGMVRDRAAPA